MVDPYREPTEGAADSAGPSPEKFPVPETKEAQKPAEKVAEAISQAMPPPVVPPAAPAAGAGPAPPASAPAPAGSDVEKERQLKILVDMAFGEGINKAVEAARATGDAYLIDKLHDTLIDELHEQLVEKGKLKE